MGIKWKKQAPAEHQDNWEPPCIVHTRTGFTVMCTGEVGERTFTGFVLCLTPGSSRKIGERATDWNTGMFSLMTGELILSNEE